MMAVDGDITRVITECVHGRWQRATGQKIPQSITAHDPWPETLQPDLYNVEVAIARTLPAYDGHSEVREIESLYLDLIAAARHYIYIENQYFTSAKVGELLAERLQEADGPEVVMVLRQDYDGWLEIPTVSALRARLLRQLHAADRYRRLYVYYPVVPNLGDSHVNIHSKLLIADDEYIRIGSANLSNRSMGADTECDLAIEARGEVRIRQVIAGMRDRLLGEHLGVEPRQVATTFDREGSLGRAVKALRGGERTLLPIDDLDDWSDAVALAVAFTDPERPVSMQQLTESLAPDISRRHPLGRTLLGLLVAAVIFGGLFALWHWTPLQEWANAATVREWALSLRDNPLSPVVLLGAYLLASLVLFPRPLVTLAAVVIFGPWLGFFYALAGILVTALLTYGVGRLLSRDAIRRLFGVRLNRISRQFCRRGLLAVIAFRLLPIAPFIVVNVMAGALRVHLSHYTLGTAIAMLPGLLAATVFGNEIGHLLSGQGEFNGWLVTAVVAVAAIGIYGVSRWLRQVQ
jgi:uncharacterized membrane protein YdjX (TVP38/TMEM64 family)